MKLHAKKSRRRRLTLLEVLIAFTLIILSLVPLLSPHVTYYRTQRKLTEMIRIDHAVSMWYASFYEKMLDGEISWEELPFDTFKPIEELPISASYLVKSVKDKGNVHLLQVHVETDLMGTLTYYAVAKRNIDEAEETAADTS